MITKRFDLIFFASLHEILRKRCYYFIEAFLTKREKCFQCSVNNEISLELKVYFFIVTCKSNNLVALRLTNQVTEISGT